MKIKYFQDTDTLYIEFKAAVVSDSRDLDENTLLELDSEGGVAASLWNMRGNVPIFRNFLLSKLRPEQAEPG